MGPKKNDDKVAEMIQRDDERYVVMEGKLSSMEERMDEMMRLMASGFERLELRKVEQVEENNRRGEGLISSDLTPNPSDSAKPGRLKGDSSGKEVMGEPRSQSGARYVSEMGPDSGSAVRKPSPWRLSDPRDYQLNRRVEVPLFDGEDAKSWVLRVEQYLELCDFSEKEKLKS